MAAPVAPRIDLVDDGVERELVTGEAVALDVKPTSYILRAAGTALDWLVYVILFVVLVLTIVFTSGGLDQALRTALVTISLVFSFVIAPMTVEVATHGRSVGKLAVGGRIVRDDGGATQVRHAFIRALTGVVEIYMTFGGLAALVGLLNSRSKRLGDLIAGTYSQLERVPAADAVGYGMPPQLAAWASIADVARLPDRLSRRIAQFLHQSPGMTPAARAGLSAELAGEAASFVSPLPEVDAETFLVGVAALRRERDFRALTLERERLDRLAPVLDALPHRFPER
ncbi:RDD family protein [Diaminobutyricibacter sp. McL0608]|uniref:RDD family protein n=1 Tax=Leifsonia sp. McL0608 TaxID=3143537 RepID=UPI0031F2EB77